MSLLTYSYGFFENPGFQLSNSIDEREKALNVYEGLSPSYLFIKIYIKAFHFCYLALLSPNSYMSVATYTSNIHCIKVMSDLGQ
jgi:hypothetical protein